MLSSRCVAARTAARTCTPAPLPAITTTGSHGQTVVQWPCTVSALWCTRQSHQKRQMGGLIYSSHDVHFGFNGYVVLLISQAPCRLASDEVPDLFSATILNSMWTPSLVHPAVQAAMRTSKNTPPGDQIASRNHKSRKSKTIPMSAPRSGKPVTPPIPTRPDSWPASPPVKKKPNHDI